MFYTDVTEKLKLFGLLSNQAGGWVKQKPFSFEKVFVKLACNPIIPYI